MLPPTDTRTWQAKAGSYRETRKPFRNASQSTPSGLGAGKVTSTRAAVFRAVYPLLGATVGVPVWPKLQELIQSQDLEPRPA